MANSSGPVTLPAGYTIEQPQAPATPPPGYTVEGSTSGGNGSGVLSTLKSVAQAPGDIMKGEAQEAIESAGETISALPFLGKHLISPESLAAERAAFAPKSIAEKGGQIAGGAEEPLLEFVLGDEALKGLSLAERVGLAGKIAKIAQESPYIGKLLEHGVSAARQGLVAGLQEGERSGSVSQGVAAGGSVAATSTVLGAAATAASKIADLSSTAKSAPEAVRTMVGGAAADRGVTPKAAVSIRDVGQNASDAIKAQSKGLFAALDKASGGEFTRFEKSLDALDQEMDRTANIDQDAWRAALAKRMQVEMAAERVFDQMKNALRIDPKMIDEARGTWNQMLRMKELGAAIRSSTTGRVVSAGVGEEELSPKKLYNRLNSLYDKGTSDASKGLQGAIGPDRAKGLLEAARKARDAQDSLRKTIAFTVKGAKLAGGGALIGLGAETVKKAMD